MGKVENDGAVGGWVRTIIKGKCLLDADVKIKGGVNSRTFGYIMS